MKRLLRYVLPIALCVVTLTAAFAIMQPKMANVAYAQGTPTPEPGPTTTPVPGGTATRTDIGVVGTGRVFAPPDTAVLNAGVEFTAATLAEATNQASTTMDAVLNAIKAQGVLTADIQTSNYSVFPITSQPEEGQTPKITGYRVSNSVTVKVRDIANVGKVLDAAIGAGANSIGSVFFTVDDPSKFENDARVLAVKDAQDKAAALAQAASVKVGRIIAITESTGTVQPLFRDSFAAAPSGLGGAGPIETGQNEISVSVEMHFEIAQ